MEENSILTRVIIHSTYWTSKRHHRRRRKNRRHHHLFGCKHNPVIVHPPGRIPNTPLGSRQHTAPLSAATAAKTAFVVHVARAGAANKITSKAHAAAGEVEVAKAARPPTTPSAAHLSTKIQGNGVLRCEIKMQPRELSSLHSGGPYMLALAL